MSIFLYPDRLAEGAHLIRRRLEGATALADGRHPTSTFRVEQLESNLEGIWRFDTGPEYPDFFWARQERYAELGLEVSTLAQRLRAFGGLPVPASESGEWDRERRLRAQRDKIRVERRRYE